ncbi:MAG: hypothetical protein Q8S14_08005, partial [Algoriphagus sp.]|uniref:hypothetical protein n=1 Tax=Algoriphagus sp. TaxID=1872435 RepID=UPI002735A696
KNIDCSASPGTLVFVTNAQQGGRVGRTQKRAGVRPCARKLFCVLIFCLPVRRRGPFGSSQKDEEKTTLEGPNGASFQTCAYLYEVFRLACR